MTIIQGKFGAKSDTEKEKGKKKPVPFYQFHVSLAFSDPLIWRRIQVPGEYTLHQFHELLRVCMGWSGENNHQFYVGKVFYTLNPSASDKKSYDEKKHDLQSLEEAIRWCFTYIYDAGDGWEHDIVLEEVLESGDGGRVPTVIDGEWAAPPEEVGSVHEYAELISALENPGKEYSSKILDRYGVPDFDPALFDSDTLNDRLKECETLVKR